MSEVVKVVEGAEAPSFELPASHGKRISLKELRGRNVVLYFYPKDDTPGCTREACNFRDSLSELERENTVVLGVSMDDLDSHERFTKKYGLTLTLLSDVDGEISKKYGVHKLKNLYGKKRWGLERSTFIIDEKGIVRKVFRKVNVDGHSQEVLDFIRGNR